MDGRKHQPDEQTLRARALRQNAIHAERKLWSQFSRTNKGDFKIRRQHPIGPFVVDFYCFAAKLVLEIDGSSHLGREAEDLARDKYLSQKGIEVMRVGPSVADEDIFDFVQRFREICRIRAGKLSDEQ